MKNAAFALHHAVLRFRRRRKGANTTHGQARTQD